MQVKNKLSTTKFQVHIVFSFGVLAATSSKQQLQLAANSSIISKKVMFIADKTRKIPFKLPMNRLATEFILCQCTLYRYKSHTINSDSSYRAFYSLDNYFKIISDLRSFQKSDNFSESFASISLNANIFCMQIYHNQKLLFLISVKFEYCENLKKIRCLDIRQFSRGFKTGMDFLT